MNWDRVEGKWKQQRGKASHHWGKVMNDELAAIAGRHEQLVGILQEKYGVAKEEARQQIDALKNLVAQLKKSNSDLTRLQISSEARMKRAPSLSTKKKTARRKQKRS